MSHSSLFAPYHQSTLPSRQDSGATALNFTFDGRTLNARPGQSVAAALLANGIRHWRQAEDGSPRGLYCGVGQCWECRCIIDGRPNARACMTEVRAGLVVRFQHQLGSFE